MSGGHRASRWHRVLVASRDDHFGAGLLKSCFLNELSLPAEVGDAPGNFLVAAALVRSIV